MDKKPLFIISLGSILVIVGIILTVRMNGIQGSKEVGRNRMSTSIKENKRSSKTTEEWSVETGPHNTVSNAKGTILKINLEESKILVEVEKSDLRFSSKEVWLVIKQPSKIKWYDLHASDVIKFYYQTSQMGKNPMKVREVKKLN